MFNNHGDKYVGLGQCFPTRGRDPTWGHLKGLLIDKNQMTDKKIFFELKHHTHLKPQIFFNYYK